VIRAGELPFEVLNIGKHSFDDQLYFLAVEGQTALKGLRCEVLRFSGQVVRSFTTDENIW
jgi:hypothetical protein